MDRGDWWATDHGVTKEMTMTLTTEHAYLAQVIKRMENR